MMSPCHLLSSRACVVLVLVTLGGMGTRAQGADSLHWLHLILGCPKGIFNSKDTAGALLTKPQGSLFEGKQTVSLQRW